MASFENANYICTCYAKKCDRNCRTYRRFTHTESNADRIRSMIDEELAKILNRSCPPDREADERCLYHICEDSADITCILCWEDWLKQECET